MYRLGTTPWEGYAAAAAPSVAAVLDREEADRTPPLGRAIDLGCGRGQYTPELARRGWEAVGVDIVPRAIADARRAGAPGVTDVVGDVTDLPAGLGTFDLFLDVGCFQGLDAGQRAAEARGVNIEDLDLAARRCSVKDKGARSKARRRGQAREGFVLETVYWEAGTARLLPRLLRGRIQGPGTGWALHEYRHSALTHLGEQGASLLMLMLMLMLMAKSRHKKPENVRRYVKPSHEAISELTSLLAPGDSRR